MSEWVYDSIVGFLQSPLWADPVNSFVDEKCVVFDPEEENKLSYHDIFKDYQALVERLLEDFLSDLGMSAEQFVEACEERGDKQQEEHEHLFEQVSAAQDFIIFKSMMIQRNVTLELRALELLQKRLGYSPGVFQQGAPEQAPGQGAGRRGEEGEEGEEREEEKLLEEVLRQSKEEYDLRESQEEEELQRQLRLAREESLRDMELVLQQTEKALQLQNATDTEAAADERPKDSSEEEGKEEERRRRIGGEGKEREEGRRAGEEEEKEKEEGQAGPSGPHAPTPPPPPPAKQATKSSSSSSTQVLSGAEAAAVWLSTAKAEATTSTCTGTTSPGVGRGTIPTVGSTSSAGVGSSSQDLAARTAYLRRQRDLLLEKKQQRTGTQPATKALLSGSSSGLATRVTSVAATSTSTTAKPSKASLSNPPGPPFSAPPTGPGAGGGREGTGNRRTSGDNTGVLCPTIAKSMKES